MNVERARTIASEMVGVGKTKVRISTERLAEVAKAITRADVKGLVESGAISVAVENGLSRGRARVKHARRKQGRYRTRGSKKGTLKARLQPKEQWKVKVRALRKALAMKKKSKTLSQELYRDCYLKVKGNWFRNKKHLEQYVAEKAATQ